MIFFTNGRFARLDEFIGITYVRPVDAVAMVVSAGLYGRRVVTGFTSVLTGITVCTAVHGQSIATISRLTVIRIAAVAAFPILGFNPISQS